MPVLAHVITQNRDGCAFDEASDAVDEGRAPFRQLDILDHGPRSLTLPASTVNVQKLRQRGDESEFDGQKDKTLFAECTPEEYLSSWQMNSQRLSDALLDCTGRVLADSGVFLTYLSSVVTFRFGSVAIIG
jgi:hypothetical protein